MGIHNDTLRTELLDGGFVSIGWNEIGDLRALGAREEFKAALAGTHPDSKPDAIAAWADILLRFRDEMQAWRRRHTPYKPDSTANFGVIASPYTYVADAPTHKHRRSVTGRKVGVSCTVFTQPALYELPAFLTSSGSESTPPSSIRTRRLKKRRGSWRRSRGRRTRRPEEIARRREELLKKAGLDLETLRARGEEFRLSLEQALILKEIDDLDFLAGE